MGASLLLSAAVSSLLLHPRVCCYGWVVTVSLRADWCFCRGRCAVTARPGHVDDVCVCSQVKDLSQFPISATLLLDVLNRDMGRVWIQLTSEVNDQDPAADTRLHREIGLGIDYESTVHSKPAPDMDSDIPNRPVRSQLFLSLEKRKVENVQNTAAAPSTQTSQKHQHNLDSPHCPRFRP